MLLDNLELFLRIVEKGGLAAAGRGWPRRAARSACRRPRCPSG